MPKKKTVLHEWHLVSNEVQDAYGPINGPTDRPHRAVLHVEQYADGTGQVFLVRGGKREPGWFQETTRFEHEPAGYLDGSYYAVTQVR